MELWEEENEYQHTLLASRNKTKTCNVIQKTVMFYEESLMSISPRKQ